MVTHIEDTVMGSMVVEYSETVKGIIRKLCALQIKSLEEFDDHCKILADALEDMGWRHKELLHSTTENYLVHLRETRHNNYYCSVVDKIMIDVVGVEEAARYRHEVLPGAFH